MSAFEDGLTDYLHSEPVGHVGSREASIARVVEPACASMGYALVRVRLSGGRHPTLQIMAERTDGRPMTVEDCAELSQNVSAFLDVEDPIPGGYTLEVSSPGIDRPLVRRGDFVRFRGYEAKVELLRPLDGRRRFRGRLGDMTENGVRLALAEGGEVELAFEAIGAAKLVINDDVLAEARQQQRM
ncbi:MAG: ribosome maturation factor RimP [Alphaproteobacteria bacterium]|nr:ribosome maturation factor RimP [Alphaproteobacteria bacterium]